MQSKYYKVTNNSEGAIVLMGRACVKIPGKCIEHVIKLPAASANNTVARLKQSYPMLKITSTDAPKASAAAPAASAPAASAPTAANNEAKNEAAEAKKK